MSPIFLGGHFTGTVRLVSVCEGDLSIGDGVRLDDDDSFSLAEL